MKPELLGISPTSVGEFASPSPEFAEKHQVVEVAKEIMNEATERIRRHTAV
jgi:hypothetical protein